MLATSSPFPQYFDTDGTPLDAGKLYFGSPNLNPETSPVAVYWDAAGTLPATQPIRTSNGYTVRTGAPALVYIAGDYSLTVRDSRDQLVFYAPNSADFSNDQQLQELVAQTVEDFGSDATGKGASTVGVEDAANNFPEVADVKKVEPVLSALAARAYGVSVTKYGAGLGSTSDWTAAFVAAFATGKMVYAPNLGYPYKVNLTLTSGNKFLVGDGVGRTVLSPYTATNPVVKIDGDAAGAIITYFGFENLSITGNARQGDGIHIFNTSDLHGCDSLLLTNVAIQSCRYGINCQGRSIWNRFENVFIDFNLDGVHCETNQAMNSWDWSNCRWSRNQRHGLYAWKTDVSIAGMLSWSFTNCNSEYNGQDTAQAVCYGIYVNGSEGWTFDDLVLENNGDTLTSQEGYGIYITGSLGRGFNLNGVWAVNSKRPIKIDGQKKSGRIENVYRCSALFSGNQIEIACDWANDEAKIEIAESVNATVFVATDGNGNTGYSGGMDYDASMPSTLAMANRKKMTLRSDAGAFTINTITGLVTGDEITLHNFAGGTANAITLAAGLMTSGVAGTVPANTARKFVYASTTIGGKLVPIA